MGAHEQAPAPANNHALSKLLKFMSTTSVGLINFITIFGNVLPFQMANGSHFVLYSHIGQYSVNETTYNLIQTISSLFKRIQMFERKKKMKPNTHTHISYSPNSFIVCVCMWVCVCVQANQRTKFKCEN